MQFAAAARASLDAGTLGGVVDFLFASGDQNFDDGKQNGFKADPNYDMGMLLFDSVLAAQTARGVYTASDPDLVGVPAFDLERYPTQGSITNTLSIFPRVWWSPVKGLEVYGGALVALSAVSAADPLNTKLAGGTPRNALGGKPGSYLGTEFDLGIKYQLSLGTTRLTTGIEGALFEPGNAFTNESGSTMARVYGGRIILNYEI